MENKRTWYGRKVASTETVEVPTAFKRSAPTWDELPNARSRGAITINDALGVSAVYACVDVLSTWTSQLELGVYRNGVEIPAPTFVREPEYGKSLYSFLNTTVISLALAGNAFWRVSYNAAGLPVNIEVLNPLAMVVERDNGKVIFRYTGYANPRVFSDKEVKHLVRMPVPGRLTGLGAVEAAEKSLNGIVDLRAFAENWFNDSGIPTGVLEVNADLDSEEIEEAQARWHNNSQRKRTQVTDKNTKYRPITLDPSSAMFIEYQQFLVTEIARWFRVPASLVLASVDGNSMTYSNLTTDMRLFVTSTLMAYMKPIEEALTSLVPRGQIVRFKTEGFLRPDQKERYENYAVALENKFMTVDEVRAAEGMPPLTEGDTSNVND